MTSAQHAYLIGRLMMIFADRPKMSVSEWAERALRFDEPDNRGPFSLSGREYCREPLDNWANPNISDQVEVFASQTGKTAKIMAGAAWTVKHDPARIFWVGPIRDKVRSFSKTRWQAMLQASPELAELIQRKTFTTLQQILGGSIVDFVWSNSPSALSSDPARIVIMDEVDKFPENPNGEADAANLAEQRTKNFVNPKRFKSSTPTLTTGLIWQGFLPSDQRRRFVPCPGCGKHILLVWSRDFTIFKLVGCEAFMRWDDEARRKDGSWDEERIERSARHECPFCGFHIRDGHKMQMDKNGIWKPTAAGKVRGYHLPGMYSSAPENGLGRMALRFIRQKNSLLGLQGFINGDLAEPWENQEARSERVEIISRSDDPPLEGDTMKILTADYQLESPHLPYVIREWSIGHSRLVEFGFKDKFAELRAVQLECKIPDNRVCIDSGHAATEVYDACLQWGRLFNRPGRWPMWIGWMPAKGFDRRDQWISEVIGPDGKPIKDKQGKTIMVPRPFSLGSANLGHKRFRLPLLEFSTNHLKDILERLRAGKTAFRWELTDKADEEYFKHLDADIKKLKHDHATNRGRYVYVKRNRTWPDHLRDCEIEQIAMAMLHKRLPLGREMEGE